MVYGDTIPDCITGSITHTNGTEGGKGRKTILDGDTESELVATCLDVATGSLTGSCDPVLGTPGHGRCTDLFIVLGMADNRMAWKIPKAHESAHL